MLSVLPPRLLRQACPVSTRRSFFSFPSPFANAPPAQPVNPNSKLRKRGSINIYTEDKVFK